MSHLLAIIDPYSIYVNYSEFEAAIKKTRSYNSQQSREQAEATRQKILDKVYRLFNIHGYTATTLAMIADAAHVSLPTVTARFGTKYAILDAMTKQNERGDTAPESLVDRSWWQAMLREPNPVRQLTLCGEIFRTIHQRTTDIF